MAIVYDLAVFTVARSCLFLLGYNPTVDPQISHVFQSAAMRFGHTLVTSGVYLRNPASEGCTTQNFNLDPHPNPNSPHSEGVRTCNSFWRSPVRHSLHSLNMHTGRSTSHVIQNMSPNLKLIYA